MFKIAIKSNPNFEFIVNNNEDLEVVSKRSGKHYWILECRPVIARRKITGFFVILEQEYDPDEDWYILADEKPPVDYVCLCDINSEYDQQTILDAIERYESK